MHLINLKYLSLCDLPLTKIVTSQYYNVHAGWPKIKLALTYLTKYWIFVWGHLVECIYKYLT